jgi:sirohydrochlorin ferrochelatase
MWLACAVCVLMLTAMTGTAEPAPPIQNQMSHYTSEAPMPPAPANPADVGFLVVAADRGFLGNEEVRDAFAPFAARFRAELAFVPWDGDPARYVRPAVQRLQTRNARRITVLPLFLEASHPLLQRLRRSLDVRDVEVAVAEPFGRSYLAEEILVDQLRAAGIGNAEAHDHGDHASDGASDVAVLLVGAGAIDDNDARAMQAELQRLVSVAGFYLSLKETKVEVLRERAAGGQAVRASFERVRAEVEQLASRHSRVVVMPFHLAQRLDSMMDVNHTLRQRLSGTRAEILAPGPLPHAAATLWMAREANRWVPLANSEIGYVVMAHGSHIDWNESIRQPLAELEQRHAVEYAFSMADPPVLERAVRRLEARGYRGIVVLRMFSLASSFQERIDFLLGLSDKPGDLMNMGPPARVRSAAVFTTLGGIDDHPLFARALLDRARELSKDPAREALLLVGHGSGTDDENQVWLRDLASITRQMREFGANFAAMHSANWREDWPELRRVAVADIRAFVDAQRKLGRTVLVIPARTTLAGPEQQELGSLDGIRIGSGFAPHPLFAQWVTDQFERGKQTLAANAGWNTRRTARR